MMADIVHILNEELLNQQFGETLDEPMQLKVYQTFAYQYSRIENSIAVLSDLRANKSYIYNGGVAANILDAQRGDTSEIDTIWEEEIFNKIHPDDLIAKHSLELQFFHLLKNFPVEERSDYFVSSRMRMLDKSGEYIVMHHRMFYVSNDSWGSLWLSLCLYNYSYDELPDDSPSGIIANSATGEVIKVNKQEYDNILSVREKEILSLIDKGKMSKEIADSLSISKNTVDRHRQNILEKLRVKNSIEACRIAKRMDLI